MDLEAVAKELKMLAGREGLTAPELDRAKNLMAQLKGTGMANPEIVELTGGRWSESTTKGYTRGVRATDPEPWKSTAALFSEMLSKNLTLAAVSEAMTISAELDGMGSSLGDVASFMEDLKRKETNVSQLREAIDFKTQLEQMGTSPGEIASFVSELEKEKLDVPAFVLLSRDWHEAGLAPADAQTALSYKAQLEKAGLDIGSISQIAKAAGKFGSPGEVLGAVAKYGNLDELDQEVQNRQKQIDTQASEMESRTQEIDAAEQKMQEVQNKITAMEKTLATYQGLKNIGFDEKTLAELATAAEKYTTPRNVLSAINHFSDLSKIKAADNELRNKVKQKRAMVKGLDEQYAHLKEPIELCKMLLKRRFGLAALSLINRTAWRYGEPTEIMKAIEAYGALKEIQKKTAQAKVELFEMEGKIDVQKEAYADYKARNKEILDQFEVLNAKAIEVGVTVGRVQEQLKDGALARSLVKLLQNPGSASYEEHAPIVLVLLKDIAVWAAMNKNKFSFPSLVDKDLQELIRYLGGS